MELKKNVSEIKNRNRIIFCIKPIIAIAAHSLFCLSISINVMTKI